MFRAMIPPIFRSTRLCVTGCGIMNPRWCRQRRGCIIPQVIKHSLVLLKMGGINARNMLSLLELLNKPLLLHLVGVYIIYILIVFINIAEPEAYRPHQSVLVTSKTPHQSEMFCVLHGRMHQWEDQQVRASVYSQFSAPKIEYLNNRLPECGTETRMDGEQKQ